MMARLSMVAITAFALSGVLVGVVRRYALKRDVLDHPNERSSHARPTPRGGGLGMLVAIAVVFAASVAREASWWLLAPALAGVALAALVGWLDDHGELSVRARLAVHGAASALIVPLALAAHDVPPWLRVVAVAWWMFFFLASINVVNFIDGIDGLIGSQALVVGANLAQLSAPGASSEALGASMAGAAAGFLVWNWSPARIFLGDAGSGGLGALFVTGGLLIAAEGGLSPVHALLPLFPIFLDATVTLLLRAQRRERLTQAHRSHLYQRLANGGWGHARVSLLFVGASALAIPVATVAARSTVTTSWALMVVYAAVIATGYSRLDLVARRLSTAG